jgi:multimeric flavodoxin WrbA
MGRDDLMQRVKILGISGSPRHANTETLVHEALKAAQELGPVDTELVSAMVIHKELPGNVCAINTMTM